MFDWLRKKKNVSGDIEGLIRHKKKKEKKTLRSGEIKDFNRHTQKKKHER